MTVVPEVAAACGAGAVFVAEDFGPYGRERDAKVAANLGHIPLRAVGSAYAVPPGTVTKGDGTPFKVFTPFSRAWRAHGWGEPVPAVDAPRTEWVSAKTSEIPADPAVGAELPPAGEQAALERLDRFLDDRLAAYRDDRNLPAEDATSRLSPYLKWGAVHPRTILARLGTGAGADTFRNELAWREFYADVLFHRPDSAREHWNPSFDAMPYAHGATATALLESWRSGRTGYPIVDAGMRQLAGEGWMHNRVRMIVASFFVKDLHLPWTLGARHFMEQLVDGDLASNQHGWQWVNGSGTDAAPYFRVFNPVSQGQRFDPTGEYVRRWIPELRGVRGAAIHDPAALTALRGHLDAPVGLGDYPLAVVDHAVERVDALERYRSTRS
ncbi:MAG: deoxyribodipyrimidine photo-lyase [Acidimicrobiales bacterium]